MTNPKTIESYIIFNNRPQHKISIKDLETSGSSALTTDTFELGQIVNLILLQIIYDRISFSNQN